MVELLESEFIERELTDKCGVFAIYGHPQAALKIKEGLYGEQHRGQDGAGMVIGDAVNYYSHKDLGLVLSIFTDEVVGKLPGHFGIGHGRYSTQGANVKDNLQPHWATIIVKDKGEEEIWLASNGDLTNIDELRNFLSDKGPLYQLYGQNDAEVLVKLVAYYFNECQDMTRAIQRTMRQLEGAYSVVMLARQSLYVFRDPLGMRPLALGRVDDAYVIASETCAFDIIEAKYIRDVFPGEIFCIRESRLIPLAKVESEKNAHCIFEFIYFARPDSIVFGEPVSPVRQKLGERLYIEKPPPANADLVITVPDSSNLASLWYYYSFLQDDVKRWLLENTDLVIRYLQNPESVILPAVIRKFFAFGLVRSHYVQRTFIEPEQLIRDLEARLKYNPDRAVLRGKIVVIVDDSIVRGTTSRRLVRMVRYAGAKEVHLRVSSPPLICPCFYGIDMPIKKDFLANNRSIEQIRAFLEVDSLGYLSHQGLLSCVENPQNFCTACFTGEYPTPIPPHKLAD